MTDSQLFSWSNTVDLLLIFGSIFITIVILVMGYFYLKSNRNYDIALKSLGRFEDLAKATRSLNETKEEVDRLEKRRDSLNAEINSLGAQQASVNQMRGELDALGSLYESRQKLLNEVESKLAQSKALSDFVENHKNDQIDQLDKLIAEKEQRVSELTNQLSEKLQGGLVKDALKEVFSDITASDEAEKAQKDLDKTKKQITKLKDELNEISDKVVQNKVQDSINTALTDVFDNISTQNKADDAKDEYEQLQSDIEEAHEELDDLKQQIKDFTAELSENKVTETVTTTLNQAFADMGEQLNSIAKLATETANLESKRDALKKEIEKLHKAKTGEPSKEEKDLAYAELEHEPQRISEFYEEVFNVEPYDESEEEALNLFQQYLLSKKFFYSQRTVNAFHTSLKVQHINPISVLAGLSGTGKTRLALLYGNFFGFYREVVAVQPRWDSKDDLLGFYNFLEKRYQPTELVKALYYFYNRYLAVENGDTFNPMMMVVLDEMNLARVEYYFSEFLSKLELRAEDDNLSQIDIGTQLNKRSFKVKRNVVLVGTMNDDESTYSLSDKVLDRANVLHFGKPPKFDSTEDMVQSTESVDPIYVDAATFAKWCELDDQDYEGTEFKERVLGTIEKLNQALDLVGKAFGYRVKRSISAYVRLYPSALDNPEYEKWAMADQIEMKIIPKLAGLEKNDKSDECLNRIKAEIINTNDKPLIDAFQRAYDNYENDGMFLWRGVTREVTPNGESL